MCNSFALNLPSAVTKDKQNSVVINAIKNRPVKFSKKMIRFVVSLLEASTQWHTNHRFKAKECLHTYIRYDLIHNTINFKQHFMDKIKVTLRDNKFNRILALQEQKYMYAMDYRGIIYIAAPREINYITDVFESSGLFGDSSLTVRGKLHHTSFFQSPASAAGFLHFSGKKIVMFDNDSGHYQPGIGYQVQLLYNIIIHDLLPKKLQMQMKYNDNYYISLENTLIKIKLHKEEFVFPINILKNKYLSIAS